MTSEHNGLRWLFAGCARGPRLCCASRRGLHHADICTCWPATPPATAFRFSPQLRTTQARDSALLYFPQISAQIAENRLLISGFQPAISSRRRRALLLHCRTLPITAATPSPAPSLDATRLLVPRHRTTDFMVRPFTTFNFASNIRPLSIAEYFFCEHRVEKGRESSICSFLLVRILHPLPSLTYLNLCERKGLGHSSFPLYPA